MDCKPCAGTCCTLVGGVQRRYKGYDIKDVINVCSAKEGGVTVESDIEVAFPVDPLKSGQVRTLIAQKKDILTMELGRKIKKLQDEGVVITDPWYHAHYNPNRLPEIGALHVHVRAKAASIPEGKKLAERIWKIIDAKRLSELVE
jgi:hypothetical protein